MTKDLDGWQGRLERHFSQLATSRNVSDYPLFALEHGLTPEELKQITRLLHASLGAGRAGRYWLVWVVYATEFGYDYDGEEYWQSFEDRTPGWREYASRSLLRAWFRKFQVKYQGVVPTGAWSDWFTIIAWPITHAILPKYLQLQLARTLFSLRYHLARLESLDAAAVGRLLAASAWDATSRFAIFLQQEVLVGRLVLALLSSKDEKEPGPLLASTLRRIAEDLERVRSAREWLRETRRVVADRFKGVGRAASKSAPRDTWPANSPPEPRQALLANIRPSVLLRRTGPLSWAAFVEIGGFVALSRLNADLRSFLRGTRCRIRGAGEMWMPAGWTLTGNPRRILKSWPGSTHPLLAFERPNALLEHLLQSECRLSTGRNWLFRVGADGIAREIVGRFVRCLQNYIIVSPTELLNDSPHLSRCEFACEGVFAYRLRVPEHLSTEEISALQRLSLQVARTIRIWPAAILSRGWDDEGHCEWLTTEMPCFGIVHDHPVETYTLQLDREPAITIAAKAPGVATFFQLPRLAVGHRILTATVNRLPSSSDSGTPQAEGVVSMEVREPLPWMPGTTSHVGMTILVDPIDPKLDDFWNEDVDVTIHGPVGHQVHCTISFRRANGEEIAAREVGTFELPIADSGFRRRLHDFVRSEANTQVYVEAASANLIIRGDELGEYSLQLSRDITPIRWVSHVDRDEVHLRLIDDTGTDEPPTLCMLPFRAPLKPHTIDMGAAVAGMNCAPPGGLSMATKGSHADAVIVSSPHVEGGLQGLALEIGIEPGGTSAPEIISILEHIELWMKTRLVGPLAGLRRDRVVRALCQTLYGRLCGPRWARAEAAFLDDPSSKPALDDLVASVDRWQGFAISLDRDHAKTQGGTAERVRWFSDLARSFHVCSNIALIEFALRLAGQPQQLSATKKEALEASLRQVSDRTALLRGARLLALLDVAKRAGGPGSAIPRWTCRS